MTKSKLTAFISALVFVPETLAHPGHVHSQNLLERMLHATETEWLVPLLAAILIGIAGYIYLKYSGSNR